MCVCVCIYVYIYVYISLEKRGGHSSMFALNWKTLLLGLSDLKETLVESGSEAVLPGEDLGNCLSCRPGLYWLTERGTLHFETITYMSEAKAHSLHASLLFPITLAWQSQKPGEVDFKVTDLAEEKKMEWRRYAFCQQHFLFESRDSPRLFLSSTARLPTRQRHKPGFLPLAP